MLIIHLNIFYSGSHFNTVILLLIEFILWHTVISYTLRPPNSKYILSPLLRKKTSCLLLLMVSLFTILLSNLIVSKCIIFTVFQKVHSNQQISSGSCPFKLFPTDNAPSSFKLLLGKLPMLSRSITLLMYHLPPNLSTDN